MAGCASTTAIDAGMTGLAEPEEVRLHLAAAAQAGAPLTYAELLERLGYSFSRPKMRALCAILGAVDEAGALRGEPELAVLVVRQSDGLPGQGWWAAGGGRSRGYEGPWEGPEAKRFIDRVQAQTFDWWQSRSGTEVGRSAR
jgi:hypothetical protein